MIDQMLGTIDANAYVIRAAMLKAGEEVIPVKQVLNEINNPDIAFVRSHLIYKEVYKEALQPYRCVFFLYRDFRDCLVSSLYWDARTNAHQKPYEVKLSDEQKDELMFFQINKHREIFIKFAGWLDVEWVHKLKWEDFISNPDAQTRRLSEIAGGNANQMKNMIGHRGSNTLRKGSVGDWKEHFNDEHLKLFWEYYGDVMERFGYI